MAQFETIEPTELLKRNREEETTHGDRDLNEARNIAYELRPQLETLVHPPTEAVVEQSR